MFNDGLGPTGSQPPEVLWQLFMMTGQPGYYMMYKDVLGGDDDEPNLE